ncbi:MAG: NUDIX hydrolase [Phycisphaerales bacterium]
MTVPHHRPVASSLGWKTLASRKLHTSKWFDISQDDLLLPDGNPAQFTYVEHPGAVFVVPVTPDGDFILLRSFRYPIDDWCLEIPAGGLGDQPGKTIEEVAQQELLEETGYQAEKLIPLGSFWMANGFARNRSTYYLGLNSVPCSSQSPERTESLTPPEIHSSSTVLNKVMNGEFNDGDSAFAVMLALNYIQTARSES